MILLSKSPIHEYAFLKPEEVIFSEEVRGICKANSCGMYGSFWACPSAVGSLDDCKTQCLEEELNILPDKIGLIINRAPKGKLDPGTLEEIENQGLSLLGVVPHDETVYQYDCDGKPTVQLPEDSPVKEALRKIVVKLNL